MCLIYDAYIEGPFVNSFGFLTSTIWVWKILKILGFFILKNDLAAQDLSIALGLNVLKVKPIYFYLSLLHDCTFIQLISNKCQLSQTQYCCISKHNVRGWTQWQGTICFYSYFAVDLSKMQYFSALQYSVKRCVHVVVVVYNTCSLFR